jgi:NADP-dependent 3-hydroxy acid dehydrogenase YdfG
MLLARATIPALKESKGVFVVTGSVAGRKAMPGSPYSSTKWAVHGFAESLRQYLVGTGVRTSVIAPGRVDTPFWENGVQGPSLTSEDIARAVLWIADQPEHVDVNEVLIRPIGQQG